MGVLIKNRTFTITDTTPIGAYSFEKDNACITIKNIRERRITTAGVYSLQVTFDAEFTTSGCLTSSNVIVKAGCKTATISFEDICSNLVIGTIAHEGNYRFSVNPTGGDGGYQYTWNFDGSLFRATSATNLNYIQLQYIGSQPQPFATTVRASVKTEGGCEGFTEYNYVFCRAVVYYAETSTSCLPTTEVLGGGTVNRKSYPITLSAALCAGTTLNMTTFSPDMPTGMYYSVVGSQVYFGAASTVTPGNKQITFSVKDSDGNTTTGTLGVLVNACPVANTISIPNSTFFIACDDVPTDIFQIPIEPNIVVASGATVDWTSFAVSPAAESGTTIALVDDTYGNHFINYTIPSGVTTDAFGIKLCDTNGGCSNLGIITVINQCRNTPVLTAKTPACNCGASVTTDIKVGGTINAPGWNFASLVITQAPTYGTVTLGANGTIVYTAPVGYNGSDTVKYRMSNSNGIQSNEATATYTVSCAGISKTITVCNPA